MDNKHWLLETLGSKRDQAILMANSIKVYRELGYDTLTVDMVLIERTAEVLEMVVLDLLCNNSVEIASVELLRTCASDAYRLFRILPRKEANIDHASFILKMCCLAVLGDQGFDAAQYLSDEGWPQLPLESRDWKERTWAVILDIWLRLIRKQGWNDRDLVLERIASLRDAQAEFEAEYLESHTSTMAKLAAFELIGLYHLARAAEIFALYMTDGVVEGNYQIGNLLDSQFERVFDVFQETQMIDIEPLTRLLAGCSKQMIENSIWTVTRSVNSRVTKFVETLVSRGRGERAIFDVLPPQRRTLAERGLLGSSRRSVVVSLPTSSGKTLIAQFRILQALNQFDHEHGWVVYLTPTRTLVNQVTRQLRRDFAPLGVVVEKVSPALEVDTIESDTLLEQDEKNQFRVIVTTPEKLDLMLRQGWEEKIGRPLTLVVVDEAHNIQNSSRGLKLEMLLSTINKECQSAQFLLLTPFISNAAEVAKWLGGTSSDDISLSMDWQPNDRVIGVAKLVKGASIKGKSYDYDLDFITCQTIRDTLFVDDILSMEKDYSIANTYSKADNLSTLAAITAQNLHQRGSVIVMHARPDWVWRLAEKLKTDRNKKKNVSEKISLVQDFLELEYGDEFPLIDLLNYGIGVHHAGLSDEVRLLMEWLFEEEELGFLVATTTIAQGVNFPVNGVVLASHHYPSYKHTIEMPPEDFWNIAGRAGRIGQSGLGVVALVANNDSKKKEVKDFINRQVEELNSALISMVRDAQEFVGDLWKIVYRNPEWSSFVQFLTHAYRQMGKPEGFVDEIEQVLRGTFGYEKLRIQESALARLLLQGVRSYAEELQNPNQPIGLVDSTGFSLQSIKQVLAASQNEGIHHESWDENTLFSFADEKLQSMMGILLEVPELRENLRAVTGGSNPDGNKLALIIKDWVNGVSVKDIAIKFFMDSDQNLVTAMTKCGQNLYGSLSQTASWGLSALLSITGGSLSDEERTNLSDLPSYVYYGVNDPKAIALRLLGVPRSASKRLADEMENVLEDSLIETREVLTREKDRWIQALGQQEGSTHYSVWRIIEGLD